MLNGGYSKMVISIGYFVFTNDDTGYNLYSILLELNEMGQFTEFTPHFQ
jgi:hypothetical protein